MSLIWLERSVKLDDTLYKQSQHWLIDEDGRILACVKEPQQDNAEDSVDAYLRVGEKEQAEFYSLDHAKHWAEREVASILRKKKTTEQAQLSGVAESVPQKQQ
jgi:hypothetical protein